MLKMNYYVIKNGSLYLGKSIKEKWTPHIEEAGRFLNRDDAEINGNLLIGKGMFEVKNVKLTEE